MKLILFVLALAIAGGIGYCLYRGLTGEKNNAGIIAIDAGNLAQSVTDTFKDGAADIAKDVADKAKKQISEAVDSVKGKASEAKDAVVEKTSEIKDTAKEKAGEVADKVK